ncbi:MAG: hypothetical protein KAR01_12770, partial [Desulfocapsa sp.]|nr:hypothetical protein [Desulfocapsa sp.]
MREEILSIYGHCVKLGKFQETEDAIQIIEKEIPYIAKHNQFYQRQNRQLAFYSDIKQQLPVKGQHWFFDIRDVLSFSWESYTSTIYYQPHKLYTDKLFKYWLLHTVLPLYLTVEQIYTFLHAASVQIEEYAILFTGDSMAGKSTLLRHFLGKGHTLISDDKTGTYLHDESVYAVPSHPYQRPFRQEETLGDFIENFAYSPLPIKHVFELIPVAGDQEIIITKISGYKKFKILRYHTDITLPFLNTKRLNYITK